MTANPPLKLGLSVREAGWLLQKSEGQVRGMLRRGELSYAVEGRKVDPASVERLLDRCLATCCLRWLRHGLIVAPRPRRRHGPPASLYEAVDALLLTSPRSSSMRRAGGRGSCRAAI